MLKQSDTQYRNIAGKHFECYTSNPAEFTKAKSECKKSGLSYRIIESQFYREVTKELQSKEEAIETVKTNNEDYYDLAIAYAEMWINDIFKPFTSEDLSKDMYLVLGVPDELRVLGAVINYLRDKGLIKHFGFARYKAKQGHGKPCNTWITVRYSKKQSYNRKKNKTTVEVEQIDAFKQK